MKFGEAAILAVLCFCLIPTTNAARLSISTKNYLTMKQAAENMEQAELDKDHDYSYKRNFTYQYKQYVTRPLSVVSENGRQIATYKAEADSLMAYLNSPLERQAKLQDPNTSEEFRKYLEDESFEFHDYSKEVKRIIEKDGVIASITYNGDVRTYRDDDQGILRIQSYRFGDIACTIMYRENMNAMTFYPKRIC